MSEPAYSAFECGNEVYAAKFDTASNLPTAPKKRLAIVTCMDSRIDVLSQLGLKEGDAHIIRNAGGSAQDSLRSLIISQRLLNTHEIAIFHHTKCGMATFKTQDLRKILKDVATDQTDVAAAHAAADSIDFLEFSDLDGSVKSDVEFLRDHPLILKDSVITGWVYHVETGKIRRVV